MYILKQVTSVAIFCVVPLVAVAQECAIDRVNLRYQDTVASFSVEVVDTAESRAQGLMFREEMPEDAGMLFIYEEPQTVTFWMKNTLIPLDMLFVGADGIVLNIKENATPLSEETIPGGTDVLQVLEINGGLTRELGIGIGALMQHPSLDQSVAAWPCD